MHKELLVLGLLRSGPRHGYDLHRIVRAHGGLYADLKQANLYYLLDRLAREGCLDAREEPGARGRRGSRLVYTLTDRGSARFDELLRITLRAYEPVYAGVEVAIVFLAQLPRDEAVHLLEKRRQVVADRRGLTAAELGKTAAGGLMRALAADHLLSLIDAELAWLDRSLARLREDEPAVKPAEA